MVDSSAQPFTEADIDRTDKVFDKLLELTGKEELLKSLLQLLCTCWHTYLFRVWDKHYGDHEQAPNPDETATVPKTKTVSE